VGDSIVDKEAASACGVKYIEFSPGIEMLQHRLALDFLRRDIFAQ
jgi:phosphoglycolate phosphatase-like HAD superfamily hydrolase